MDLEFEFTKKQLAFDAQIKQTENTFYGGAKGGGKSHGLRLIMLKRRFEIRNSFGVIFRKTYPELYGNHISKILKQYPMVERYYNRSNKEICLPNGSILAFRHCQYERDLGLHQGQEYHDLAIEEAGEWPEDWFWTLKGSNRSSEPGIIPKCLLTGNPGGIGHKWLKRLFVDRNYREGIEDPEDFAFIPATVYDNPALIDTDPKYINRLKSNKNEALVKAYLGGSWDIQAGQFFDNVSRETHLVRPFEIPKHWEIGIGFDYGYNHPAALIWVAADTDGNYYVYRELVKAGMTPENVTKEIMKYDDWTRLRPLPAGHDCWVKRGTGPSIEEKVLEASGNQIVLTKATIDRVAGAVHLRDYLEVRENGPRLRFFSTCPITFDCIVRMTHDTNNAEDVLKVDAEKGDPYTGDDPYDALRYYMMSRPRISTDPKPQRRRGYFKGENDTGSSWTTV